jgi:hypothetical protein
MSDLLGLGAADGESRWIGVRRHQAGLAIAGLGLIGEWITQAHSALIEVVAGVAFLACAAPTSDGPPSGSACALASTSPFARDGRPFGRRFVTGR